MAKNKSNKTLILIIGIAVLVLLVAAAAVLVLTGGGLSIFGETEEQKQAKEELLHSEVLQPGISVNGIDVGGLTMLEAKTLLEERMSSDFALDLVYEGKTYTVTAADVKFDYNIQDVLEQALMIGRNGSYDEMLEEIEEVAATGREFTLSVVGVDATGARRVITKAANEIDVPAASASVTVDPSKAGTEEVLVYVEGNKGYEVDQAALFAKIEEQLLQGNYDAITIPVIETEAEVSSIEELKQKMVLRGSAYTSYAKSPYNKPDRVFNIEKSVGLCNGVVVKPGETFSMNDTIGPRTYNLGWKGGAAIVGGRSETQAGGGVCQTSTTLYNAVLKADLEIVSRRGHSGKLGYVAGGLDATINTGTIDFKWRNNTNSDIIVVAYTKPEDKTVHYELYGEPFANDEYDSIELTSSKIRTIDPPGDTVYTVVPGKPASYKETWIARKSGQEWASYKIYMKDGKEVRREKIANTVYKAYAGEIKVGEGSALVKPSASVGTVPTPTKAPATKAPATKAPATKAPSTEPATPTPTAPPTAEPTAEPPAVSGGTEL